VIATSRAEATRAEESRAEETATVEQAGAQAVEDTVTEEPATEAPATEEPAPDDAATDAPTEAPPTAVAEQPTSAAEPAATAVPPPAPTAAPQPAPQPAAPSQSGIHVVQAGETLFSIARRYGTTVDAFVAANSLPDATHIEVGQQLIIPGSGVVPKPTAAAETTYVVKRGDNLFRIALSFGLTYQELAAYNGIGDPDDIYAGQVLRIPPR
jgi:LysM repeat protein